MLGNLALALEVGEEKVGKVQQLSSRTSWTTAMSINARVPSGSEWAGTMS